MSVPYAEVIGDPIAHSKSPAIHKFWLAKLGIEGEYRARHIRADGLANYFALRRKDPDWRGCNITLPHKIAAMDLVATPERVRAAIGAINTVVPDLGGPVGANTDAEGFIEVLADAGLAGAEVALVGAGGAARAVLAALRDAGVGRVTLLNRSIGKAAAALAASGCEGQAFALDHPLPPARLLVNTTTLGMIWQPDLDLDLAPLPADAIVYDIVYAPLDTPLLKAARARGLRTLDGLNMLVGQAAVAFEMFFGQPAPRQHDAELRAFLAA